jgi:hypothetical protein
MASDRQIAANRRNARRSTGPRTQSAKLRARANALRHGFRSEVLGAPAATADVEELARRIALEHGKPDHAIDAKIVAEAEIKILKIRTIRAELLNKGAQAVPGAVGAAHASVRRPANQNYYINTTQQLLTLERYEQRAISRRRKALRQLRQPDSPAPNRD